MPTVNQIIASSVVLRVAALLPAPDNARWSLAQTTNDDINDLTFAVGITGAVGTVSALLRGSVDGVTYFDMPTGEAGTATPGSGGGGSSGGAVAAPATILLRPTGPIPPYLTVFLTPGGGFSGLAGVTAYGTQPLYATVGAVIQ